jgi:uncharacterized protein (TIGR03083 family)
MTSSKPAAQDFLLAYRAIHERIAEIVTDGGCDVAVPACPGWRVHDVLAHLGGLCQDWVDHRLEGYASDAWTSAQVARLADRSCTQVLDLWAAFLAPFDQLDELFFGSPPARWAFGDAVVHEADIRGALGVGHVPEDAVTLALDGTMARWRDEVLSRAGLPPLHVRPTDSDRWRLGPANEPDTVVVEAPLYEIFRALAGRRSRDQVRDWAWSSDPEPYIAAGLPYPFRWAAQGITD